MAKQAEPAKPVDETETGTDELSPEELKIIRVMELLELMELLEDMDEIIFLEKQS